MPPYRKRHNSITTCKPLGLSPELRIPCSLWPLLIRSRCSGPWICKKGTLCCACSAGKSIFPEFLFGIYTLRCPCSTLRTVQLLTEAQTDLLITIVLGVVDEIISAAWETFIPWIAEVLHALFDRGIFDEWKGIRSSSYRSGAWNKIRRTYYLRSLELSWGRYSEH